MEEVHYDDSLEDAFIVVDSDGKIKERPKPFFSPKPKKKIRTDEDPRVDEVYSILKTYTDMGVARVGQGEHFPTPAPQIELKQSFFNLIMGRQQHRSNPPVSNTAEFWKRSLLIPYMDSLISSLERRFSDENLPAFSLF
ncbi:zinc finger MYM-type protein 1-like [Aphis craccivora]|uniref:Zinc finger MYM-type protein 1-like n=1 Tax=Aphis craccivora TaxID=307492 RepID=A0A6G0WK61_APHCR|nr:zinc finger MYM-type protein 1-like [Aphis craccivora]